MNIFRKLSPFCKSRGDNPLDMIVIHHIGSKGGKIYSVDGAITWFTDIEVHKNKETGKIENQVSAHYIVPREPYKGYDVIQCVDDDKIAYHAGESSWTVNGIKRTNINRYSIGIELEGDGNNFSYTDYQYEVLIELLKDLMEKHAIKEELIVGHEDVSPGRKIDPGKLFDWKRVRSGVSPPVIVIPEPPVVVKTPVEPEKNVEFYMEPGVVKGDVSWVNRLLAILMGLFKK